MDEDIQRKFILAHPDHKLFHDLYVYIAQQLHKIKMTSIPNIMDDAMLWDPQRNIAIRYGDLAGKLYVSGSTNADNASIPRILWNFFTIANRKSLSTVSINII